MRSLLVFNPFATSTNDATKKQIVEQLSDQLDLTVHPTTSRGEATQIATNATLQGFDVIIGYGGDGTMNEIANGLLHNGPNISGPILGALPGGNANVFARNLEFSANPIEATQQLVDSINNQRTKTIGVGRLDTDELTRWFLFNSGFGIDAAVLAKMDERRQNGKRVTDNMYTALAIQELLAESAQRDTSISLRTPSDEEFDDLRFALVINLAPWIYIGERPITLTPNATMDKALSVYALADLSVSGLVQLARNLFGKRVPETNNRQLALADQKSVTFESKKPLWVQVDGEALSKVTRVQMSHVANALRVFA